MKKITIQQCVDPKNLDILKGRQASYKNLNFVFSESYLKELKNSMLKNGSLQLIVEEDGNFAGYVASETSERWLNYIEILELFIDPQFQGKGIGTKLTTKIIDFAKTLEKGVIAQTEKDNLPAQKLYEKFGFVKIKNLEWLEGITYKLDFKP